MLVLLTIYTLAAEPTRCATGRGRPIPGCSS